MAMFSLASGDRSSCEMSWRSRRSAVSNVSMRPAITLKAAPDGRSRPVARRDTGRQVTPPEAIDRSRHVAKRRDDVHGEQPAEEGDRGDDERVVRRERPHVERRRRQNDQPMRLSGDGSTTMTRSSCAVARTWSRLVEERRIDPLRRRGPGRCVGQVVGGAERTIEPREERSRLRGAATLERIDASSICRAWKWWISRSVAGPTIEKT